MGRKSKFSVKEKLEIVQARQNGDYSLTEIKQKFNVDNTELYKWIASYEKEGIKGLEPRIKNNRYSPEVKEMAVLAYLAGKGSLLELSRQYGLASKSQLADWIKKYNGHEKLKSYKPGERVMTRGRKTTLEERVDIAQYCIANNYGYQMTCEKFLVSYQQVYQWVRKLEDGGSEALKDRRGRTKSEEELTEAEKLKLEIKRLNYRNSYLEIENEFLKKLEEIGRS